MLVTQAALFLVIAAMAFSTPAAHPGALALLSFLVAFCSASQDIVVDAWRTEVLAPEELGPGAGVHILGYRVAMLTSGAIALILADRMPWRVVYLLMAGSLVVGMIASLLAPEPELAAKRPRTLKEAVVEPFLEFFARRGAAGILLFIVFYKLDVVMATALTTPFLLELGFTMTDIGAVTKGLGMIATIAGTLAGGAVVARTGMKASLWIFGLLQSVSTLTFLALARLGHHYPMMVAAIGIENLCSGMGTAAYAAFLMSLCDKRFTATQYALLTSLMAVTRRDRRRAHRFPREDVRLGELLRRQRPLRHPRAADPAAVRPVEGAVHARHGTTKRMPLRQKHARRGPLPPGGCGGRRSRRSSSGRTSGGAASACACSAGATPSPRSTRRCPSSSPSAPCAGPRRRRPRASRSSPALP